MSMSDYKSGITKVEDTPFGYTLSIISGKWKMPILYLLAERQVIRFNELQRILSNITYKTLSIQLRELEADGLVDRKEYPQIPPKVEYRLSERGATLIPIFEMICEWGIENKPEVEIRKVSGGGS